MNNSLFEAFLSFVFQSTDNALRQPKNTDFHFLFSMKTYIAGKSLEALRWGVSKDYYNICFRKEI